MKVPVILQYDSADCGAAALYSVAKAYNISSTISEIRSLLKISRVGSTLEELKNASSALGLRALPIRIRSIKKSLDLSGDEPTIKDVPTPFICLIDNSHWIVIEEIKNKSVRIMDPSVGSISLELEALNDRWIHNEFHIILAFENELPGLNFSSTAFNIKLVSNLAKAFVQNTYEHKNLLLLIATSSMFILLFQAIIPFLTQGLIDIGLTNYNGKLVLLFLIAQLCIFILSSMSMFIHQYITVLLGKLININTVKNFISMLLNLPLSFYASINTGDILTRFNDIDRIEQFFSRNFVSFIFSLISLLSYILLLYFFESNVFYLSLTLVFLYLSFNFMYMSKRVSLDYESFKITSDIEGQLIEAVSGMVDIRIYQSSKKRLAFFEKILSQMIDLSKRETKIDYFQNTISELLITTFSYIVIFILATKVISSTITFGTFIAIQFVFQQVTAPLRNLLASGIQAQRAAIAYNRLSGLEEFSIKRQGIGEIGQLEKIEFRNVYYTYPGTKEPAIVDLSLEITCTQSYAIVGESGSGKSTIFKLLLKSIEPDSGQILINGLNIQELSNELLFPTISAVFNSSFIFSDSLTENICEGVNKPYDMEKVFATCRALKLNRTIEGLSKQYETKVGPKGSQLSQGQNQRLLLARALMVAPVFLLLDESLNALDARTEASIIKNLSTEFTKTSLITIAHRLSSIQYIDYVFVMHEGRLIESGKLGDLSTRTSSEFCKLFQSQLSL